MAGAESRKGVLCYDHESLCLCRFTDLVRLDLMLMLTHDWNTVVDPSSGARIAG